MADLSKVAFSEKLGTTDKKILRPINPVNSEIAGNFAIEIVKDGAVIARKLFAVSDNAAAPAAAPASAPAQAPAPAAPTTPATGEVKVEAPAAPATVEVKTN